MVDFASAEHPLEDFKLEDYAKPMLPPLNVEIDLDDARRALKDKPSEQLLRRFLGPRPYRWPPCGVILPRQGGHTSGECLGCVQAGTVYLAPRPVLAVKAGASTTGLCIGD